MARTQDTPPEYVSPQIFASTLNDDRHENEEVHKHHVRKRVVGRRLDKYLHGRYPRLSRTIIQRYIKQGQVTVNGLPTKASYEPCAGDLVRITLPPPPADKNRSRGYSFGHSL